MDIKYLKSTSSFPQLPSFGCTASLIRPVRITPLCVLRSRRLFLFLGGRIVPDYLRSADVSAALV